MLNRQTRTPGSNERYSNHNNRHADSNCHAQPYSHSAAFHAQRAKDLFESCAAKSVEGLNTLRPDQGHDRRTAR
jgi:hypothetical protein